MDCSDKTGLVYDLQRFAIHDGPGIRTLVYMKGCPIRCIWCSSPQTQKTSPEILHVESNCQKCGRCVEECPIDAIALSVETGISIDRDRCTGGGPCVDACLNQALTRVGKSMTVEELFKEVSKDSPFYRRSNGGVTMGGGESTMQHEFVAAFLKRCRQGCIHTVLETCGFVKWEHLEGLLENLDLVYLDVKHMDASVHKEITGASNELILENAGKVSALRPLIIRIPVLPGHNDSDDNIVNTAKFAAELDSNFQRIELLPYHKFGTQNYSGLGREYTLADIEPPDDDHMTRLKELVESCGIDAQIGG